MFVPIGSKRRPAQPVCSETNVSTLGSCVRSACFFPCLCSRALYGRVRRETIPCLCICVWDGGLGYSAVQIAEPPRTNGCRHLLSLVSHTEKGRTIQSEQSRVTNEGDISAERPTDNREEDGGVASKQKWRTSGVHRFCVREDTL